MGRHLLTTWRANYGDWLLGIAVLASIVVSCVWHFDAIPEVALEDLNDPRNLKRTPQARPTFLIASIVPPKSLAKNGTCAGYVILLSPIAQVRPEMSYLLRREFQLVGSETQTLALSELSPGRYSAVAFLDLDGNQELTFGPQDQPTEPYQLYKPESKNRASIPAPLSAETNTPVDDAANDNLSDPEDSRVETDPTIANSFELGIGQLLDIRFNFENW